MVINLFDCQVFMAYFESFESLARLNEYDLDSVI